MSFLINILIAILISAVVSGVLTYILSFKFEKAVTPSTEDTSVKNVQIDAPVMGQVMPLSAAHDEVFASGALGQGVVVLPTEGEVFSPVEGEVTTLFPTKHAIGIVSSSGVEVLIHIGIDTVDLNGKYFESFVEQGDQVTLGEPLIKFDIEKIKEAGYSTETMVIITNSKEFESIKINSRKNTDESTSGLLLAN